MWRVFYMYMFSKLVFSAVEEGLLFTMLIFIITFSQQCKAHLPELQQNAVAEQGRDPRKHLGQNLSMHFLSHVPVHAHTHRPVCTPWCQVLCQCHQKLSTLEEEGQARKMTTTSPFGPVCFDPGFSCTEYQQQIYVLHAAGQIIQSWEECPVVCVGAESHLWVP